MFSLGFLGLIQRRKTEYKDRQNPSRIITAPYVIACSIPSCCLSSRRAKERSEVEIKHGRVSMLACTGYIAAWFGSEVSEFLGSG